MSKDKKKSEAPQTVAYGSLLGMDRELTKKSIPKKDDFEKKLEKLNKRQRSPSPRRDSKKWKSSNATGRKTKPIDYDVPDRSFGDLYCKPCDSHMNSEGMWEAHISGKRHIKHTRNIGDAAPDQKYDYIDEPPSIQDELDSMKHPVIGLEHMCEIQRLDQKPMYICYLCSGNVHSLPMLKEHIIGVKHRIAYLKEHDLSSYDFIQQSNLKKGHIEAVVEDCVMELLAKNGSGKMQVKVEKYKADTQWKKWENEKKDDYEDRDYFKKRDSNHHMKDYHHGRRDDKSSSGSRYIEQDKRMDDFNDSYLISDAWRTTSRDIYEDLHYNRASSHSFAPISPIPTHDTHSRTSTYMGDDSRYGDLRQVIEHKKALDERKQSWSPENVSSLGKENFSDLFSHGSSNVSDKLLGLINSMPLSLLLQLSHFKIDSIKHAEKFEIQLMEKVANKFLAKVMELKSKKNQPNLRAQFEESISQVETGFVKETEHISDEMKGLMNMVGECRAKSDIKSKTSYEKTLNTPDSTYTKPAISHTSEVHSLPYPLDTSHNNFSFSHSLQAAYPSTSKIVGAERKEFSFEEPTKINTSTSSWTSYPSFSKWNPLLYSNSISSSSAVSNSSLFDQFASNAKDIFGNISVPQNNKYNRHDLQY